MKTLEEKMKAYCDQQNELSNQTIKMLVEYVNANGGDIDTSNEDYDKDDILAFAYDEGEDRYKDYKVDRVKTDGDCLLVHIYDDVNDYDENWYSVNGGMVVINATLYSLCECLPEYVNS